MVARNPSRRHVHRGVAVLAAGCVTPNAVAHNCSSLSDCYGTLAAAALAALAIALLLTAPYWLPAIGARLAFGTAIRHLAGSVLRSRITAGLARIGSRLPGRGRIPKAPSIRNVNPLKGKYNCVNCSIATDSTLAGRPASALLSSEKSIAFIETHFGGRFAPATLKEIQAQLLSAGNGARGIVFGSRGPNQVGHVFNAVNRNGRIRFLDGQIGRRASVWPYKSFEFLRTF